MSDAGLRIYNESGNIQVTNDAYAMGLSAASTLTLTDDGQMHPQPMVTGSVEVTGTSPIIAFLPVSPGVMVSQNFLIVNGSTYKFSFRAQSRYPVTINYWVFDVPERSLKDPGMSSAGLRVYDSSGLLTFDAATSLLRTAGYIAPPMPPAEYPGAGQLYESQGSIQPPSGRVYAAVQSLSGYAYTMWEESERIPGDPPWASDPWNQPKYMVLESYYSAAGIHRTSGALVAGLSRFEHFQGWYPQGQNAHIDKYGELGFLIVDVTDFIGGGGTDPNRIIVNVNATQRIVTVPPGVTSITPTVTASATGGSGSGYSCLWTRVGGDTQVTNYSSTTGFSFNTQVYNPGPGTFYSAVYRPRITDSQGNIGFGPEVTFVHYAEGVSVTPGSLNWTDIDLNTPNSTGTQNTNSQTITGITDKILVRAYMNMLDNTLESTSSWAIYVNGTRKYSSAIVQGAYVEAEVSKDDVVYFRIDAGTTSGRRALNSIITVRNISDNNNILDTFLMKAVVDNDDNHNVPDPYPDMVDWTNVSGSSTGMSHLINTNTVTISGINQNINLIATITNLSTTGNPASNSNMQIFVNAAGQGTSSGIGNGYWARATVKNGDKVYIHHKIYPANSSTTATVFYRVTVTVEETGEILDTYTVNQSVNVADTTPDSITWPNQSVTSVNESISGGYSAVGPNISGINRSVRLRFQVTSLTSNLSSGSFRLTNIQGSTHSNLTSPTNLSSNASVEVDVSEGTNLTFKLDGSTTSGIRQATGVVTVTNVTTQQSLGTFNISITVDSDNSSDYTPNPISVPTLVINTPAESGYSNAPKFQITGIGSPIVLRFSRNNQVDSGGVFTRRLFIYKSSSGSNGPWTEYAIGAGVNNTIDIPTNNNDWFYVQVYADTTSGKGTATWDNYIHNISDNNTQLAYFQGNVIVDSDNNFNIPDPNPNPIDFSNVSGSSSNMNLSTNTNTITVGGINQQINLRATITNFTSTGSPTIGVASSNMQIYVNGVAKGQASGVGNAFWAAADVVNGDSVYIQHRVFASNANTTATVSYTVTLKNMTTDTVLDTYTVTQTANAVDQTPNSISWPTQSWSTTNTSVSGAYSALGPTIAGINRPTQVKFKITSLTSNLTSGSWAITNIQGSSHTNLVTGRPMSLNAETTVTVSEGTNLTFKMDGSTNNGKRQASGTITVTNATTGAGLGSFPFSVTVDSNNTTDVRVDPITSFGPFTIDTPNASGSTPGAFRQIKGISQGIVIRISVTGYSGNLSSWEQKFHYNPPGSASSGGPWSHGPYISTNNTSRTFNLTNNQWIYMDIAASSASGRRTGSWTTTVYNDTTGEVIDSFTCSVVVDSDDNHNVSGPPIVTVEPSYGISGSTFGSPGTYYDVFIGTLSAYISGGQGPFTYTWERSGGTGGTWTANPAGNPSGSSCNISVYGRANFSSTAYYRCKVTDAIGRTAYSEYVETTGSAGNIKHPTGARRTK